MSWADGRPGTTPTSPTSSRGRRRAGRGEGLAEAVLEVAPAQEREHHELEPDDDGRADEGDVVLRDQERQRVQDPAEEGAAAGDGAANIRAAPPGQLAGVGEALGEGH